MGTYTVSVGVINYAPVHVWYCASGMRRPRLSFLLHTLNGVDINFFYASLFILLGSDFVGSRSHLVNLLIGDFPTWYCSFCRPSYFCTSMFHTRLSLHFSKSLRRQFHLTSAIYRFRGVCRFWMFQYSTLTLSSSSDLGHFSCHRANYPSKIHFGLDLEYPVH